MKTRNIYEGQLPNPGDSEIEGTVVIRPKWVPAAVPQPLRRRLHIPYFSRPRPIPREHPCVE